MKYSILFILAFALLNLTGCATTPKHKALRSATLPKQIPLRDFVANTKSNFYYQVSPDGEKVAWLAVKGTKLVIHFKRLDLSSSSPTSSTNVQTINTHSKRSIFNFNWAQDSHTLFYHQDQNGNENTHVYAVSIDKPKAKPIDLTPLKGAKATIVAIPRNDPKHIFIRHNQRDKTVFDLFKLNLQTHKLTKVAQNSGKIYRWFIDDNGKLRGRFRKISDEVSRFDYLSETTIKPHSSALPNKGTNKWTKVREWSFDEHFNIEGFTNEPPKLWVTTNIGRDKTALFKMDVPSGALHYVYGEKDVDLGSVYISQVDHQPIFVTSMPGYPRAHFFDPKAKVEFKHLKESFKGYLHIVSADNSERNIVVSSSTEKQVRHYLHNRDNGKSVLLGVHALSKYESILSSTKPVSFKSRDGLLIHGYLTIPKGLESSSTPLPMILKVHGGPWARDRWHMNQANQFFANRGYAVLQINYRGSTGYGKRFVNAAIKEFAGKMHTDLVDGVNWAVSNGVADKDKICIVGGSYGGYATLVGLTFTPDLFACGVDIVGPSNLVSLLKTTPAYWKTLMPYFYKFVGDPNNPEHRKDMESRSPLFKVDQVIKPLLIVQGANDPRVKQAESDQMVKALRRAGKEVEYLLFKDEGHGIRKWTNNLIFQRKMEDFLAKHLGGRSAGFDYYQIGTLIF